MMNGFLENCSLGILYGSVQLLNGNTIALVKKS